MKNPLHYQFSEYDCGPTTMQNAISFLFERRKSRRRYYEISCYIVWTVIVLTAIRVKAELPVRQ